MLRLFTAFTCFLQLLATGTCFVLARPSVFHHQTSKIWKPTTKTDGETKGQLSMKKVKATTDGETLWRLNVRLSRDGDKDTTAALRVRFVPDRGYEPPSGRIFIEDDFQGLVKVDEQGYAGTWTLSEDKEDRKDGLWIWGLFETPKYPFMYFYLDVFSSTVLPSGEEDPIWANIGGVPGNRLNFRFEHVVDKETGTILSNGLMNFKASELIKADPFGVGGTVDVGDSVTAGAVDIVPAFGSKENADKEQAVR